MLQPNKTLSILFLLTLLTLTSAQLHGSPDGNQGAPIPPEANPEQGAPVPAPTDPPEQNPIAPEPVAYTIDPNGVQWAPWVDPNQVSPPTREPESTPGDIFVCTDTNFSGQCQYMHAWTFNCQNLETPYRRSLSSIRPDKNQLCIFYENTDCTGGGDWIRWPGSGNMRGRRFDNRASSWYCTDDGCEGVQGKGGCTKNEDGSLKVDSNGENAKGWLRPESRPQ